MLSSCADALLRVGGALELGKVGRGVDGAEEDGLVLVHPVVRHEAPDECSEADSRGMTLAHPALAKSSVGSS